MHTSDGKLLLSNQYDKYPNSSCSLDHTALSVHRIYYLSMKEETGIEMQSSVLFLSSHT